MNRLKFAAAARQRGVVLIFSLIVLLILAIGAVALLRSVDTSLVSAGNLAFHKDLVNQGEQAVSTVMTQFTTTGLPAGGGLTTNNTTVSLPSANYSAVTLATNSQGVPLALLDNTAFAAVGTAANDIIPSANSQVTIRYLIDRLCVATPPTVVASITTCVQSTGLPTGGTANRNTAVAPPSATIYRVSVRIDGPRSTQAFLQTTFTKPD